MKLRKVGPPTLAILLYFSLYPLSRLFPHYTLGYKVIGVSDGDTITVLCEHGNRKTASKIRLFGIDCPESGQAFGHRATEFTSSMVFGKTVSVDAKDQDRYGRLVA